MQGYGKFWDNSTFLVYNHLLMIEVSTKCYIIFWWTVHPHRLEVIYVFLPTPSWCTVRFTIPSLMALGPCSWPSNLQGFSVITSSLFQCLLIPLPMTSHLTSPLSLSSKSSKKVPALTGETFMTNITIKIINTKLLIEGILMA